MNAVELTPVVKSIDVRRSAGDAFRVFTEEMSAWWPMDKHSRAKSAAGERTVRVTVEPHVGGRVYETLQDGRDLDWGDVAAYEPGIVFAMRWRMGRPVAETTDVTVRFEPLSADSCRVTLTHANWERMGADAQRLRDAYNNGWIGVFEQGFGDHLAKAAAA